MEPAHVFLPQFFQGEKLFFFSFFSLSLFLLLFCYFFLFFFFYFPFFFSFFFPFFFSKNLFVSPTDAGRFYIALFSAVEQTGCAFAACDCE